MPKDTMYESRANLLRSKVDSLLLLRTVVSACSEGSEWTDRPGLGLMATALILGSDCHHVDRGLCYSI